MLGRKYLEEIKKLCNKVETTQLENINRAAEVIADVIINNNTLHVFGTGHSHIFAEEMFYRAGGLVTVNPILEPALMLHDGAMKSTRMERLHGYAAILAEEHRIAADDVIIIASNSGRNVVPIEMAQTCKNLGVTVIALTSVAHSNAVTSRYHKGKKLIDLADIVIDNCGVYGDAILEVERLRSKTGPTSTVMGALIVNMILVEVVEKLLDKGFEPPIFISANVEGGDAHDRDLIEKYRDQYRFL